MSEFVEIAWYKDIALRIPKGVPYSFFNSPYPAHKERGGIDVYFSSEALFPYEQGKILEVKYFRSPKFRKDGSSIEPLILIDLEDIVMKVLHVKPKVSPGERVFLGDPLGEIIISGYLYKWSDPHAHFELRPKNDPYRARGVIPLNPVFSTIAKGDLSFIFKVIEVKENYVLAKSSGRKRSLGAIGNSYFCVDGGIPHYGYYGIIGRGRPFIHGKAEGNIIVTGDLKAYANGIKIRGIGTFLGSNLVKIIPKDSTEVSYRGEKLKITFIMGASKYNA